jgi:hypothetical protein
MDELSELMNRQATNGRVKFLITDRRHKAYRKIIQGLLMVAAGMFELLFDEPAPKPSDTLRG